MPAKKWSCSLGSLIRWPVEYEQSLGPIKEEPLDESCEKLGEADDKHAVEPIDVKRSVFEVGRRYFEDVF